jgi:hypothetical protein
MTLFKSNIVLEQWGWTGTQESPNLARATKQQKQKRKGARKRARERERERGAETAALSMEKRRENTFHMI